VPAANVGPRRGSSRGNRLARSRVVETGPAEERLSTLLSAGSLPATTYFQITTERVVEPGT